MKLFRKLAISVNSQVENLADRFENKEALSTAYIHEYEGLVAKAKVRLSEVSREVTKQNKEASLQKEQIETWTERARRVHATDESKALECVARIQSIQTAHQQTLCNLKETKALEKKMSRDVDMAIEKLETLKRKHQNLAGRQVCAETTHALHHADDVLQDDMDNLFTRWETDVVASELRGQTLTVPTDSLEEEFETIEQEQELRLVLEEIVNTKTASKENNNDNS